MTLSPKLTSVPEEQFKELFAVTMDWAHGQS